MKKNDIFVKLLLMYEQAEKQVNRLISGDDAELIKYGESKIEMVLKQISQEYEEAE